MGQIWVAPKGVKRKNGKVWDPTKKASEQRYETDRARDMRPDKEIQESESKRKIIERFE